MAKTGYAGKIKNTGSQIVKAPFGEQGKRGKTIRKEGNDLRVKGGK